MAARRGVKKRSRPTKGVRIAMPREVRAAYGEIQKGVAHLDGSIAEIRTGLRRAERKIETDARRRISDLRKEARAQMRALQGKQREASRTLKKLSAAAGDSWREVKRSADSILSDARATAATVAQRFRTALRA